MNAYRAIRSLTRVRRSVERISALTVILFLCSQAEAGSRQADYEQARKLAQQKKWAEAAVLFRSLLGETPNGGGSEQLELIFEFTRVLTLSGRREEALSLLVQRANREKGEHRKVVLRRLETLSRQFLTDTTFKVYQEGLQLFLSRKFSDAQTRFDTAFSAEPDNIEVLVRLGQVHVLKKEFDKAVEKLRLARRLNPFEPETRLWLGRALQQRGELKEALEELSLAQKELPDSENAAVWYSEALYSNGQKAQAVSFLDKYLKTHTLYLHALITLSNDKVLMSSSGDTASLWSARKDLQLALSRVEDYEHGKKPKTEGLLGVDLRNSKMMREEIIELLDRVSGRLEGKPPTSEKPIEEKIEEKTGE